ncbi:hypothetical protein ACL9RF_06085 [Sphingobacterium sp. Mn56C]|uniref:hypothetical protein n=1 Tax=Sphingobacterium sp. Mn56C TaxID=3395261 RepID=UPI003BBE431C
MDYVIEFLEQNKRNLERGIRDTDLMRKDIRKATQQLGQINQLKRAIKILKVKTKGL